jgi:hypothetical protein
VNSTQTREKKIKETNKLEIGITNKCKRIEEEEKRNVKYKKLI